MVAFSFRQKLVASMMLVVTSVSLAILFIAERKLQTAQELNLEQRFETEADLFGVSQQARLAAYSETAGAIAKKVRFISFLEELRDEADPETAQLLYETLENELAEAGPAALGRRPAFIGVYHASGKYIPSGANPLETHLARFGAMVSDKPAEVAYVKLPGQDGSEMLHEVLANRFIDIHDNEQLGTLLIGFPVPQEKSDSMSNTGIWLDGDIYLLNAANPEVERTITDELTRGKTHAGRFDVLMNGVTHWVFYRALNLDSKFPRAYQVSLHSLAPWLEHKRELRWKIAALGFAGLIASLVISLFLARGLTRPMEQLVRATREVEAGNYEIKVPVGTLDEVGQLTSSFNQMTAGLALKEKYRSVLDMVADKTIATDLIEGKIELGGEERYVSVLFCDIRGFTPLTEKMSPHEVIEMLNDHFTPLTRIVHQHHGAVDKFVGDLIMAIFGAPSSSGNEVEHALRCAMKMIEERQRLNRHSRQKISIGIGIASGKVVAGRMGSEDRLNYTVLGRRVNLASRLCGQAGPMEVVIDDESWNVLHEMLVGVPMPEMRLKGFASAVQAYKISALRTQDEKELLQT